MISMCGGCCCSCMHVCGSKSLQAAMILFLACTRTRRKCQDAYVMMSLLTSLVPLRGNQALSTAVLNANCNMNNNE